MREFTSLALCTLTVNWLLTLFAFTAVNPISWKRPTGLSVTARPGDILILVSFVIGVVLVSLSTWAIFDELQGQHQENVSRSQLELAAKSLLVAEALWTLVTGLLRISVGLLLYNVFSSKRLARFTTVPTIALSASLAAASIAEVFLICRPFAAQWDPQVLGACGNQVASFMALESVGLALDLVILLVPCVALARLNYSLNRKVYIIIGLNIGAV